jgi:hypothetical protein
VKRSIVMPHWSATRFMLFDQCRSEFRARYVDGVAIEPTEAMCFGKAVHMGLESHYNGQDGERAFRAAWKAESAALAALGRVVQRGLTAIGLSLIDQVLDLGLKGVPERGFALDTNVELGAPIIGALDLYDAASGVIYDFKTTRGVWSQERAQAEVWQPMLYTWAVVEETGDWPAFEYIVMNRVTGKLDRFRRQWTSEEWWDQMNAAWRHMCETAVAVAQDHLECHNLHGYCPECGERWSHDHVCDEHHSRRISLTRRSAA